jgi:putative transposase
MSRRLVAYRRAERPRRICADGLKSYGVAPREILPEVRHRAGRCQQPSREFP